MTLITLRSERVNRFGEVLGSPSYPREMIAGAPQSSLSDLRRAVDVFQEETQMFLYLFLLVVIFRSLPEAARNTPYIKVDVLNDT